MRTLTERLALVGAADGPTPEEAVALFAIARKTPDEGRLIEALLTQHAHRPLPEPLLVAVAAALVDRADAPTAIRALASANSPAALLLRADVLAGDGELEEATRLVERILVREFDYPGARERHSRWTLASTRQAATLAPPSGPPAAWPRSNGMRTPCVEGPYRCVREVARGGAGTVYEGIDEALGRRIALKVYHRRHRDAAQLLHEARVAVALEGDGVVRVYDVDPSRGWMAMDWAALGTVGSYLARGRSPAAATTSAAADGPDRSPSVPPTSALFPAIDIGVAVRLWGRTIAQALARAHDRGWVHNDVKPANLLLVKEDRVVLADFGTARRRGDASPPGSHGYLSPERLAGRASEPRDDIHAFGRVLDVMWAAVPHDASSPARADGRPAPGEADPRDAWLRLAAACTGADGERPADGAELVRRIHELDAAPSLDRADVSRRTDKGG